MNIKYVVLRKWAYGKGRTGRTGTALASDLEWRWTNIALVKRKFLVMKQKGEKGEKGFPPNLLFCHNLFA